jgi:isopentenyldiphosphate isomerase
MPLDNQSEIFVWVNEQDQELGYITRGEAHGGSWKIHRAATVLVFNLDKSKILFQQRSLGKDIGPGKWSSGAGGHVNKGDAYDITALRELGEELGIFSKDVEFLSKSLEEDDKEREYLSVFELCISEKQY